MSWRKALTLFLLLGIGYPASQFGWSRESVLETRLGPLQVLWAFAVGFGALAVFMNRGPARPSRGAALSMNRLPMTVLWMTAAILLAGYGVSGALWAMGPEAGTGPLVAVAAGGLVLVAAVWTIARGAFTVHLMERALMEGESKR